ncbi:MAG: hypothetical protein ABIH11_07850 [Candidatus Altiarchaeota archaeon]
MREIILIMLVMMCGCLDPLQENIKTPSSTIGSSTSTSVTSPATASTTTSTVVVTPPTPTSTTLSEYDHVCAGVSMDEPYLHYAAEDDLPSNMSCSNYISLWCQINGYPSGEGGSRNECCYWMCLGEVV